MNLNGVLPHRPISVRLIFFVFVEEPGADASPRYDSQSDRTTEPEYR